MALSAHPLLDGRRRKATDERWQRDAATTACEPPHVFAERRQHRQSGAACPPESQQYNGVGDESSADAFASPSVPHRVSASCSAITSRVRLRHSVTPLWLFQWFQQYSASRLRP
jgi:hypothetical protein